MNTKFWCAKSLNVLAAAFENAARLIKYNANFPEGIFLRRNGFGYTIKIDEFTLPFEMSYTKATKMLKYLEKNGQRRKD